MSKQASAAEEKARNEALRQEYELLKTKYDEQVALNLTQTQTLADKDTIIQDLQTAATPAPTPQNLSANLQGAVAIDKNSLTSALVDLNDAITARFNHEISVVTSDTHSRFRSMETTLTDINVKFDHFLNASAIPAGINRTATPPSSPRSGPFTTSAAVQQYDKLCEVDMRKARDPELTPCSIRIWQQLFDTYTQHPTRLMNAIEAFGERSYAALKILYPDDPPPIDERAFEPYLKRLFTNPTNLFSEIREATAKTRMKKGNLTVEALQSYSASFCTALLIFKDQVIDTSNFDLQRTIISAFYDGIFPKAFRLKLEESSCSTWAAALNRFRTCSTQEYVQLANKEDRDYRERIQRKETAARDHDSPGQYHNFKTDYEGKRASSAQQRKDSTPDTSQKTIKKGGQGPCHNCRGIHDTIECQRRFCSDCKEFNEPYTHLQSDCPKFIYEQKRLANKEKHALARAATAKAYTAPRIERVNNMWVAEYRDTASDLDGYNSQDSDEEWA